MEVLHGNQVGSKHSRRRSDRFSLAENRLLDWAVHESDISLQPHSPLALADVLTQEGGYLDLIPQRDETSTTESSSPIQGSDEENARLADTNRASGRENKRATRNRFNLLTAHDEAALLRQCKKILVENALVKNKGERQLYLAAGFVSWPDATDPNIRHRAPLLLFPALLVRITDEQRYEIRLSGGTPEFNNALSQHIEERYARRLPEFDEDMPLVDFFAQVAESLQSASPVELEFEVALGSAALINAASSERKAQLPDIPENFDVALAISITGNNSLSHLTAVLQLIPDFRNPSNAEPATLDAPPASLDNSAARLRRFAAKLAAEGLDHVEFRQLPSLPSMIAKCIDAMNEAIETNTLSTVLSLSELSLRELIKLSGIIELIDKAPDSIEQWGHGDLCFASSTVLLRRAQHQAKLIEDELHALQEHFHLDKVPAKSQLLSLMNELGGSIEHEPDLVDADYFNARRQFMEFSTKKPANLTPDHRRALSQLAKVLRFRELFVNNVEYRAALGTGYKGLRTDWPLLVKSSDYARELAEVLGSEKIAASIINNWQDFRRSFIADLETLQLAGDASRRLLSIVGKRWQKQSVSALSTHAALVAERLVEWSAEYGSVTSHSEKTAGMVLSSFSGPSMDHVLVETQVDETHNRIRQKLNDGEISLDQISDTLHWLAQASAAATEHDLDVESIVERLQIA